ncbi:ester cyclase [Candidatus Gracilibacteria bacterium]|nr:ester cyclase [Candidatus Gracilibacteria bacterium]
MDETYRTLVADLLAAWNDHDAVRAATFYADDYVGIDIAQSQPQHGPAARVHILRSYVQAFPDLVLRGDTLLEHDRAVLIWEMEGTHCGRFMNVPPTRRHIVVRGVSVLTFSGGKITEGLNIWDAAGLLRAIGLLPQLP